MKKRVKLTIEYLGTAYCGWQRQKNGISVQEVIEGALKKLFQTDIALTGSGRTDAGVHAKGQVAHFDIDSTVPVRNMPFALNSFLPDDIQILSAEEVGEDFHARFGAKKKTYRYTLYVDKHKHPLIDMQATNIHIRPDVALMQEAANKLVGEHDFKCFLAAGSSVKDTVRTIFSLDVDEIDDKIHVTVCGNGFLYNMVRILTGTLYYVGIKKLKGTDIDKILEGKERKLAGKTLPAKGLTLLSVSY